MSERINCCECGPGSPGWWVEPRQSDGGEQVQCQTCAEYNAMCERAEKYVSLCTQALNERDAARALLRKIREAINGVAVLIAPWPPWNANGTAQLDRGGANGYINGLGNVEG